MKCTDINEKMSLYIDNLLDKEDKKQFEKHLSECPNCREEYDIIAGHVNKCKNIVDVELPANFNDEFHNKLMQENHNKRFNKRHWKAYSVAAAVLLVIIVSAVQGQYIGNQNQTDQIAKNLEGGSSSMESLDYATEESTKSEMDIMDARKAVGKNAPQTTSKALVKNESMDAAEESNQSIGGNEPPKEDTFRITALSDSEQTDFSKKYEAHMHIKNDSLEKVATFIKDYTENVDCITVNIGSDITSEKPEITLEMPSDAFQNCLDYIAQYKNLRDYYVDIIDLTEQKDNGNNKTLEETEKQMNKALILIEITEE